MTGSKSKLQTNTLRHEGHEGYLPISVLASTQSMGHSLDGVHKGAGKVICGINLYNEHTTMIHRMNGILALQPKLVRRSPS